MDNFTQQYQIPTEIQFEGILLNGQLTADNFNINPNNNPPPTPDTSATISDSESGITGSSSSKNPTSSDSTSAAGLDVEDLLRIEESDRAHSVIINKLTSCLAREGKTDVVAIHKKKWSSPPGEARFHAFIIWFRAMVSKHGGVGENNPRSFLKYGWFGGSRNKIERILRYGFSHEDVVENNGLFGHGIYLSPDDSAIHSVESAIPDEDGIRHILLCKVLIGKPEVINPGSDQSYPSSTEFDTGIDSMISPKKYIVWTANMNTYILPEYVISFRFRSSSCSNGGLRVGNRRVVKSRNNGVRLPTSPWMPLPTLISTLSVFLPAESVGLITNYHKQFKERKMSRPELIKRVRQIAGDKLLSSIIKTFRGT